MKKIFYLIPIITLLIMPIYADTGFRATTIQWLEKHNFSAELIVIIISMLPIIELRGAIPVGIFLFNFTWYKAALLSVIGNMLPIPFVLLFMEAVIRLMRKFRLGRKLTDWLFNRTRKRGKIIERYKSAGLMIFVGIPLPGTGGWTGAMAANIFGLKFWRSLLFIFFGVLLAGVAVTILCQTGLIIFQ